MGYIENTHIGGECEHVIGENDEYHSERDNRALCVADLDYPQIYSKGVMTRIHDEWEWNIKVGDRLRLSFHFQERKCKAFYNDKFVGL